MNSCRALSARLAGLRVCLESTASPLCSLRQAARGLSGNSGLAGGGSSTGDAGGGSSPPAPSALAPGAVFTLSKQFSAAEVAAFVSLTEDSNPIHASAAAAQQRGLPAAVLPGMLMASLFPAIIGSRFPGALYLSQTLKFRQYALVSRYMCCRPCGCCRVASGLHCRCSGTGGGARVADWWAWAGGQVPYLMLGLTSY